MANLIGFTDFNPNTHNSIFYYADTKTDFVNWLMNNSVYAVYDHDNYRIDNDIIRLSKDQNKNVHMKYFYDENTEAFYNVIDVQISSNYFEYRVKKDYWGTYINEAKFSKFSIKRSNRDIDNLGYYDEIKYTSNVFDNIRFAADEKETEYEAVIVAGVAVDSDLFGLGGKATKVVIVTCSLSQFRLIASQQGISQPILDVTTGIELCSDIIGGIYEAAIWNTSNYFKAALLKCYIVPKALVEWNTNRTSIRFHTRSYFTGGNIVDVSCQYVLPITKTFEVRHQCLPEAQYFVGSLNNGLLVRRHYNQNIFRYRFEYTTNSVNVYVEVGDEQKDITKNFELAITENNATATNLEKTQMGLNVGIQVLSTAISSIGAIALGGGALGALTAAGGIMKTGMGIAANTMNKNEPMHAINGGNAANTYYTTYAVDYLACPFVINEYAAENDRIKQYYSNYGLIYDNVQKIFRLADLQIYPLILAADKDYIEADTLITNIPINAAEFITNELSKGITLQFI